MHLRKYEQASAIDGQLFTGGSGKPAISVRMNGIP